MEREQFTKKNSVLKSMRFELKPVGKTRETIKKNGVLEYDQQQQERKARIKEMGDCYFRDFLNVFEDETHLELWPGLIEAWEEKEEWESTKKETVEFIAVQLQAFADKLDMKSNADFVFTTLREYIENGKDEGKESLLHDLDELKGCGSLFKNILVSWKARIFGTKKNSASYRILENFERLMLNQKKYERFKEIVPEIAEAFENTVDISMFLERENLDFLMGQNGLDKYNSIISGVYSESGEMILKGLNMTSSECEERTPLFSPLLKQIFSEKKPLFSVGKIETKEECGELINASMIKVRDMMTSNDIQLADTIKLVAEEKENLYVSFSMLPQVSLAMTGKWDTLSNIYLSKCLMAEFERQKKEKPSMKKLTKTDENMALKNAKSSVLSLHQLNALLEEVDGKNAYSSTEDYLKVKMQFHLSNLKASFSKLDCLEDTSVKYSEKDIEEIQQFYQEADNFRKTISIFQYNPDAENSEDVLNRFEMAKDVLYQVNREENLVRNYILRKPNEACKEIPICFKRTIFLCNGWNFHSDKSQTTFGNSDNALLKKDGKFYFMVSSAVKGAPKITLKEERPAKEHYEYTIIDKQVGFMKVFAKNLHLLRKTLPGVDGRFVEKYMEKAYANDREFALLCMDVYRQYLQAVPYYSMYNFSSLKENEEYRSVKEMSEDIDRCTYKVSYKYVEADVIDQAVERSELYLFEIYSRYLYSNNKKNLYANLLQYFFSEENTKKANIQMKKHNGVRYRVPIGDRHEYVHEEGSILVRKTYELGNEIHFVPGEIYKEICAYYAGGEKDVLSTQAKELLPLVQTKKANHSIMKDARYYREQFSILLSIGINGEAQDNFAGIKISKQVREDLSKKNILTLIRGRNTLLTYVLYDCNGRELESGDFNKVNQISYSEKLQILGQQNREKNRHWLNVDKSEDIKKSYVGAVAAIIAKMAIDKDAVICMEQFSEEFKNKQAALNDTLYKAFDQKLINKLSCYIDSREVANGEKAGGIGNPIQLADPALKGTQNGIVFFMNTAYTRDIDPATGYQSLFDFSKYVNSSSRRNFLKKLDFIGKKNEQYVFKFSYDKVGTRVNADYEKKWKSKDRSWTITIKDNRFVWNKEKTRYEIMDGNERLAKILGESKETDIDLLTPREVNEIFEVFKCYASGRVHNGETSFYQSPVCDAAPVMRSIEKMAADGLMKKFRLYISKSKEQEKYTNVMPDEWLDYLMKEPV